MRFYNNPELDIVKFTTFDVITSSGGNDPYEKEPEGWTKDPLNIAITAH